MYPEIVEETNLDDAVDIGLEVGACLLRSVIDPEDLWRIYREVWKGRADNTFASNTKARLEAVRERVPIITELESSMKDAALSPFNSASLTSFTIGNAIEPHPDDVARLTGLTALAPVLHAGRVSAYPDDVFTVSELGLINGKGPMRIARRVKPGLAVPTYYKPGDVLLLRQDNPQIAQKSIVHTSKSVEDLNPRVRLGAWDRFLKRGQKRLLLMLDTVSE